MRTLATRGCAVCNGLFLSFLGLDFACTGGMFHGMDGSASTKGIALVSTQYNTFSALKKIFDVLCHGAVQ